jgi:Holliday junction resolvase RusA-like endonuclease
MNHFYIEISGDPITKLRARATKVKGKMRHYDSQEKEKNFIKMMLLSSIMKHSDKRDYFLSAETFDVSMTFDFAFPNSWSRVRTSRYINNKSVETMGKPDIDNLAKFYLDCCNKIIFTDDSKVVSLNLKKRYALNSRTIIEITANKKLEDL